MEAAADTALTGTPQTMGTALIDSRILASSVQASDRFRHSIMSVVKLYQTQATKNKQIGTLKTLVERYLFDPRSRQETLAALHVAMQAPSEECLVERLVDVLRRQLEPRWIEGEQYTRELLIVDILKHLCFPRSSVANPVCVTKFVATCAQNKKLSEILDFHLRACTYIDTPVMLQLKLSKHIQLWLDVVVTKCIVDSDDAYGIVVQPIIDLQQKYLDAWKDLEGRADLVDTLFSTRPRSFALESAITRQHGIDPRRLSAQVARTQSLPDVMSGRRALPDFRPRNIYLTPEQIEKSLLDANHMCFDILRLKLENGTQDCMILEASLTQASKFKLRLSRYADLQARLEETEYEENLKGRLIDTIQRLDYCVHANAQNVPHRDADLLPPKYYFRKT